MKYVANKIADFFFTVAAGAVIVALFEDKANSVYISAAALVFAILIATGANFLPPSKRGE